MDAPRFARDIEAIYESAWKTWRDANPPNHDRAVEHGNAARERGDIDEAIAAYQLALQAQPASAGAANNLANALWDSARQEEAIPLLRRAAENTDDPAIAGNLLFALNFQPDLSPKQILAEHVRWREHFADPLAARITPPTNDPSPDRRLRIGYVSADFRNHPVGLFMLPILARHDKANFEIVCYSGVETPDLMTQRLRQAADVWRDVAPLSDADLANLIRNDQIDILIDLALHAQGSRLLTFARKPAPVQVTYLGYAGTTGLMTIDYRLTDPYLDPPGSDETVYSEQSWRLPRTYYSYQPILQAPPPGLLPALANGVVTFASLNNFYKVNKFTLELWRDVLLAVPRSRLLLHAARGSHREQIAAGFWHGGVDGSRIGFVDRLPLAQYLQLHQQIDIALDPYPFPGATTTLDALWMGVPVVSLAGQTAVSRAGRSILTNAGLAALSVDTPEMYVQAAVKLASELPTLAGLRASLREQVRTSPLLDDVRFARDLESAYRQMWQRWCATR
jgi:predicted O-linked N-acetylglucosamine transferase (SPINDLY family)